MLFQQGAGADAEISKIYSSVEIALYDLAAKARNLPGQRTDRRRVRDRIRLYGSAGCTCHRTSTLQKRCACAKWVFTAYKMRPGRGPDEILPPFAGCAKPRDPISS